MLGTVSCSFSFRTVSAWSRMTDAGNGRSSQASSGNDMNGYAEDLAAVIEALDLRDATLVGHSMGGGEVARYIGRHGTKRVSPTSSANYAILQLCRVAANHVAQFSNGSCRFGPTTSAMKISAIISVITRLLSPGRSCRSSARLGLGFD